MQSSNKEIILNELERRINKMQSSNKEIIVNKKIQLTECNLKKKSTINVDKNSISSVSVLPSGYLVAVSYSKSIKIFESNYNIKQNILKAYDDTVRYVNIKDDNNFNLFI